MRNARELCALNYAKLPKATLLGSLGRRHQGVRRGRRGRLLVDALLAQLLQQRVVSSLLRAAWSSSSSGHALLRCALLDALLAQLLEQRILAPHPKCIEGQVKVSKNVLHSLYGFYVVTVFYTLLEYVDKRSAVSPAAFHCIKSAWVAGRGGSCRSPGPSGIHPWIHDIVDARGVTSESTESESARHFLTRFFSFLLLLNSQGSGLDVPASSRKKMRFSCGLGFLGCRGTIHSM